MLEDCNFREYTTTLEWELEGDRTPFVGHNHLKYSNPSLWHSHTIFVYLYHGVSDCIFLEKCGHHIAYLTKMQ